LKGTAPPLNKQSFAENVTISKFVNFHETLEEEAAEEEEEEPPKKEEGGEEEEKKEEGEEAKKTKIQM